MKSATYLSALLLVGRCTAAVMPSPTAAIALNAEASGPDGSSVAVVAVETPAPNGTSEVEATWFVNGAEENADSDREGIIANDLIEGECKDAVLIFARGSAEPGNMGIIVGPPLVEAMEEYGIEFSVQGVNYAALLSTNFLPENADPRGVRQMVSMLQLAAEQCEDTPIVVSGYSQGAALVHAAIPQVSEDIQDKIAGVVLFGDTRKEQSNGQIEGIPDDDLKIICNDGDEVCDGTLLVLPPHLAYTPRTPEGAEFLVGKLRDN